MDTNKFEFLLRLADNAVILSQRLCELCGKGPALEEDMALTNVALDLIGQSRFWYDYAAQIEGRGRSQDQLAFLRDAHDFRNVLLVEQPNGNYAETIVRQFFFDSWHVLYFEALQQSTDTVVAGIACKAVKEARYHLRRSRDLVIRLGDGTALSRQMMQAAVDELWTYTGEMLNGDAIDIAMREQGVGPDLAEIRATWVAFVAQTLATATLSMPDEHAWMQSGGKRGVHTEKLGFMLAEMQFMQRTYPNAVW